MRDLIEYIQTLLANPSDFELHRQQHEEKLMKILNDYADHRPPTVEQLIEQLEDQYPSLQDSIDIIEQGDALRKEMLDTVFASDIEPDAVKKFEAKISLFDKLIAFDSTINGLIKKVGGSHVVNKQKARVEVDGSQGSAQSLLKTLQDNGTKK